MAPLANKRLDALTTLVGWITSTSTDPLERTRLSNEVVRLSTSLDAAEQITLVTSHPGAGSPITVVLALAPLLKDGSTGTFVNAATVVIPAVGGLIDQAIGTAGTAMEEAQHRPAGTGLKQRDGDSLGRPIEGTTTAGHDH